jgi:type I restriction enzyme S subunit
VTTPNGWRRTALGDLGRYLNGRALKKDEWRPSGRPIIRIQNLTGSSEVFNYFQGEVEDRYVVRPGDLLVSWAATLGAYFWQGPEAVLNQHIFKVESNIDAKFHKYLLDHKLEDLMRHTHGSGMVHITRGRFDSLPVDVPDLDEQRRIVDLLEDHLSRLDVAEQTLGVATQRVSALTAATRQAIWSRSSVRQRVSDLGSVVTGKTPPTRNGDVFGSAVPFVTPGDVNTGWEVATVQRRLSEVGAAQSRVMGPGTVLTVCIGATLGKVGWTAAEVSFNQQINAVQTSSPTHGEVYAALMAAPNFQRQMWESSSATTMPILNKSSFSALELPRLSELEVNAAQSELQYLAEQSSRATTAICEATRRSSSLRRSLLAAAFSGRLTGGGPDFEQDQEAVG